MPCLPYTVQDQPDKSLGIGLATVGQLADQMPNPPVLHSHISLGEASKTLQQDCSLAGLLILTQEGQYQPLYRDRLFLCLSKPYFKDLYYRRPVLEFAHSQHNTKPLLLARETRISDAINAAVVRESDARYDPVLIEVGENQPPDMIDMRVLLEHQRDLLSSALSQVELQRQEAHVAALTDRLTGLPNRQSAMARLSGMSRNHLKSNQHDYAVLFLDFDRFKLINDSLGHDAGDELLIQISERLKETLRHVTGLGEETGRWMTARLGGDEFLVLIDNLHETSDAVHLAQAILDAMRPAFTLRGYAVSSSPSIGVATCHNSDGKSPAAMVRDADAAMYRAKSQGRARYVLFDQSMQEECFERLYLESQLRDALQLNQLSAYYQPIVSCESGQIAGFEALARWHHPELGMVPPGQFIPVAEECGLISAIGRFMLETAVNQLVKWNRKPRQGPPLYMSINISKRQLLQPGCVDHLRQLIADTGVDPNLIYLEVTETVVIDHGDTVVTILEQLKELGVKLSMDDFGTGLSSLTHLHQYPVDVLKIDQAFVRHLEENSIYTAVILAIVTLAKNLGMSIVVEGIERIEQLVQIQTLDCEYAQGYLFSKPVPADEAERLIAGGTMDRKRIDAA